MEQSSSCHPHDGLNIFDKISFEPPFPATSQRYVLGEGVVRCRNCVRGERIVEVSLKVAMEVLQEGMSSYGQNHHALVFKHCQPTTHSSSLCAL